MALLQPPSQVEETERVSLRSPQPLSLQRALVQWFREKAMYFFRSLSYRALFAVSAATAMEEAEVMSVQTFPSAETSVATPPLGRVCEPFAPKTPNILYRREELVSCSSRKTPRLGSDVVESTMLLALLPPKSTWPSDGFVQVTPSVDSA